MGEPMTVSNKDAQTTEEQERGHWFYVPGKDVGKQGESRMAGVMVLNWGRVDNPTSYPNEEAVIEALEADYEGRGGGPTDAAGMIRDFTRTMRPDDVAYARHGSTEVIGRGIVHSEFCYNDARLAHRCVRDIKWTHAGPWPLRRGACRVTLQCLTQETSYNPAQPESLFRGRNHPDSPAPLGSAASSQDADEPDVADTYIWESFLTKVFVDLRDLEQMLGLLRHKKNLILQGTLDTGKTFTAKRLAYALMGQAGGSRVEIVRFHQSAAYEDVVAGLRLTAEGGFAAAEGVFVRFCRRATADPGRDYVFITDEINRANIPKAFDGLLMLIEVEHRGEALRLSVSRELLSAPKWLHIIDMMSAADRGLALVDYAPRRRLASFEMRPALDHPGFLRHVETTDGLRLEALVDIVCRPNQRIAKDEALGPGSRIGHSYLCLPVADPENPARADAGVTSVVRHEPEPLMRKYWLDNPVTMDESTHELGSVLA